jgi:hypothetical protein
LHGLHEGDEEGEEEEEEERGRERLLKTPDRYWYGV